MKKTAFLAGILLIFCLIFLLAGCTKDGVKASEPEYCMQLSLQGDVLEGTETVTYVNTEKEERLATVLHLYANAYREDALHPAYASPLERYGCMEISSVEVNGKPAEVSYSESGEYATVRHDAVKYGDKATLSIAFRSTIPSGKLRLSENNGDYALSGFYPQLSVYQNGAYRTDDFSRTGDPYYSEAATYDVTVTLPKNEVVGASTAVKKVGETGETQTLSCTGEHIRDFALAASPEYRVAQKTAGKTNVVYLYREDEEADSVLEAAAKAVEVFGETFGEYPFDTFTVARTLFEEDGMEFSGMAFVASDTRDPIGTVLHETAHQWWYGIVGSDPINESYMDEGLATFSAAYYYALTGDEARFRSELETEKRAYAVYERLQNLRKTGALLAMNKPVYEYTPYQYAMVAYCKACTMFASMYELFGKEKFEACLREYYKDNAFAFGGKDAFVAAANRTMGDIGGLMEGWIGEGAVATTFAVA